MFDLLIVGAGPAGLTAAMHAAFEGLSVGVVWANRGQIAHTGHIENVPGYEAISGNTLWHRMYDQAEKLGVTFIQDTAVELYSYDGYVNVNGYYDAKKLVLALGKQFRHMPEWETQRHDLYYGGMPGDERLYGKDVVVIGGSNAACQAALDASKLAKTVTLLNKHDKLEKASSLCLVDEVCKSTVHCINSADIVSMDDETVTADVFDNGVASRRRDLADIVLVCVGQEPATAWLKKFLPNSLTPDGYIITSSNEDYTLFRSVNKNIFAIGDCRYERCERISCAVGDGARLIANIMEERITD